MFIYFKHNCLKTLFTLNSHTRLDHHTRLIFSIWVVLISANDREKYTRCLYPVEEIRKCLLLALISTSFYLLPLLGPPGESGGVVAEVKGDIVILKWVMGPNNMAEISQFHIEYNTVVNTQWRILEKGKQEASASCVHTLVLNNQNIYRYILIFCVNIHFVNLFC